MSHSGECLECPYGASMAYCIRIVIDCTFMYSSISTLLQILSNHNKNCYEFEHNFDSRA